MSLGHRRVLVVRGKADRSWCHHSSAENTWAMVTPQLAPRAPHRTAPTEPPITYAAEAVSWTGRLRRATPIARRPAVAAVMKDAAATVSVIAGSRAWVGSHRSLRTKGPGPSGKTVMRTTPQAMAAVAWPPPNARQNRTRRRELRWKTREASGTATWLSPISRTRNGPIKISDARA
jgi:hypothetical protein